nr:MAG TPA: hypothetical protein [Caudoviricetes sp.]
MLAVQLLRCDLHRRRAQLAKHAKPCFIRVLVYHIFPLYHLFPDVAYYDKHGINSQDCYLHMPIPDIHLHVLYDVPLLLLLPFHTSYKFGICKNHEQECSFFFFSIFHYCN